MMYYLVILEDSIHIKLYKNKTWYIILCSCR